MNLACQLSIPGDTHTPVYMYVHDTSRGGKGTGRRRPVMFYWSAPEHSSPLSTYFPASLYPPLPTTFSLYALDLSEIYRKRDGWNSIYFAFLCGPRFLFFFRQLVKTGFLHCPLRQIELGLRQLRRVKPDQNFRIVLGKAKQRGVTIGCEYKLILVPGSVRLSTEVQGQRQVGDYCVDVGAARHQSWQ